jgi:hypothetical protein
MGINKSEYSFIYIKARINGLNIFIINNVYEFSHIIYSSFYFSFFNISFSKNKKYSSASFSSIFFNIKLLDSPDDV